MVVLLCQLLLPYIIPVLRWIPLLEKGGEPHRAITGLNSLHTTIQSPIAGEEIGKGALYWIERGTLLVALALTLLCVPTEGAGKGPTHSIPELFLLAMKQRLLHYLDMLFRYSHWSKVEYNCPYWHMYIIHNLLYIANTYVDQ